MREPNPAEIRTIKALRQVNAITPEQRDAAIELLRGSELCTRCNGVGLEVELPPNRTCQKCDGTGQQRLIN